MRKRGSFRAVKQEKVSWSGTMSSLCGSLLVDAVTIPESSKRGFVQTEPSLTAPGSHRFTERPGVRNNGV